MSTSMAAPKTGPHGYPECQTVKGHRIQNGVSMINVTQGFEHGPVNPPTEDSVSSFLNGPPKAVATLKGDHNSVMAMMAEGGIKLQAPQSLAGISYG